MCVVCIIICIICILLFVLFVVVEGEFVCSLYVWSVLAEDCIYELGGESLVLCGYNYTACLEQVQHRQSEQQNVDANGRQIKAATLLFLFIRSGGVCVPRHRSSPGHENC